MIRAVVLIIQREGKGLFAKRAKWRTSLPNRWSLPADKIIRDEGVEAAVKRCAWHELALKVKSFNVLHERHFNVEGEDKTLYFVSVDAEGEAEITHDEITEIQWLSFEEFFKKYVDEEIGHGLQWLRNNLDIQSDLK